MKPARSPKQDGQLNEKQLRFAQEYLKDLNAYQAAVRAGYKPISSRTQSTRMLANPRISLYIANEFEKRSAKVELTVEGIIKELHAIATSNVNDVYADDGSIKPISTLPVALQKAISSIEVDEIWDWSESLSGKGRKMKEQIGITKKIRFWEKTKALELLGKYLAMWIEKHEVSGPGGIPLPTVTVNVIRHQAPPVDRIQTLVVQQGEI